jgi:hypothetical protein
MFVRPQETGQLTLMDFYQIWYFRNVFSKNLSRISSLSEVRQEQFVLDTTYMNLCWYLLEFFLETEMLR